MYIEYITRDTSKLNLKFLKSEYITFNKSRKKNYMKKNNKNFLYFTSLKIRKFFSKTCSLNFFNYNKVNLSNYKDYSQFFKGNFKNEINKLLNSVEYLKQNKKKILNIKYNNYIRQIKNTNNKTFYPKLNSYEIFSNKDSSKLVRKKNNDLKTKVFLINYKLS
jgi:hypothetical protein